MMKTETVNPNREHHLFRSWADSLVIVRDAQAGLETAKRLQYRADKLSDEEYSSTAFRLADHVYDCVLRAQTALALAERLRDERHAAWLDHLLEQE